MSWSGMETLLTGTQKYQVHPCMLPILTLIVTGGTLGVSSAPVPCVPTTHSSGDLMCPLWTRELRSRGETPYTPSWTL